jgi:hypothetical protein
MSKNPSVRESIASKETLDSGEHHTLGSGQRLQNFSSDEIQTTTSEAGPLHSRPTSQLKHNILPLIIFSLYATFAAYAWITICILTFRPLGLKSYGVDSVLPANKDAYFQNSTELSKIYRSSENFYRASRVINAVIIAVTIPVTSAICAGAAATYTQHRMNDFTIRQVMALANRGWTGPDIVLKLLHRNQRQKYSSSLLYIAILLHILGMNISDLEISPAY